MPERSRIRGRGALLSLTILGALLGLMTWGVHRGSSAQNSGDGRRATTEQDVLAEPAEAFVGALAGGGPLLGVNFINAPEELVDEQQYANGVSTGATWNRWPLYWSGVEVGPGNFFWDRVDATVIGDVNHGLNSNVILMGTPCFYRDDRCGATAAAPVERPQGKLMLTEPETARPDGLYDPVFSDGSDVPGAGKAINPSNAWGRFVFTTVNRYKPGGVLAGAHGWGPDVGVRVWEIWNEPDLSFFWDGTHQEYARLLKVAYLAAKQADPQAQVMFGGLAYFEEDAFLELVLREFDRDPLAPAYGYFHDMIAVHNYFHSWSSWWYVYRTELTLARRGLHKDIWLNESGVPAVDDYPGPHWDRASAYRGTMKETADFVIQSAFFATFAGADALFHFQLYDGCGNQPAGTDFPPHDGSLCAPEGPLTHCAGDAFGLFSNPTDAACFTQHPTPESPRPVFTAFRLLSQEFQGVEPLWRMRPGGTDPTNGPMEWIAFYRPEAGARVLGLWARFGAAQTAVVPAFGSSARLIWPDGVTENLTPVNGAYTIQLPGATNLNAPWDRTLHAIEGRPAMLIEVDDIAPTLLGLSANAVYGNQIYVQWRADDGGGSGVTGYDLLISRDGVPLGPWEYGRQESGLLFPVELGRSYTFTVIARDRAGNASPPQTATVLAEVPAGFAFMPVASK